MTAAPWWRTARLGSTMIVSNTLDKGDHSPRHPAWPRRQAPRQTSSLRTGRVAVVYPTTVVFTNHVHRSGSVQTESRSCWAGPRGEALAVAMHPSFRSIASNRPSALPWPAAASAAGACDTARIARGSSHRDRPNDDPFRAEPIGEIGEQE
jgi:hypothetical protein